MSNNVLPDPLNVNIASPDPLNVAIASPTSAFGEILTANLSPVVQITAQYGLLEDVSTATLGGSVTTIDSKFSLSTGTGANNVSAIVSTREAQYKAGQGLTCRITALFTQGVANSTQQAGFITSESSFCFGYNGAEFGIVHSKDGELEIQELTINSASNGGDVTVTVDGNAYVITLSTGTAELSAFEIATYLDLNAPGYDFSSNGIVVTALAQLPDFGAGAFSYSGGVTTSTGTWDEIKNGTIPTEIWTNKADWNVNPNIDIDPALGNVYQIQIQYLGFGGIRFYVENQDTAKLELVHIIKYANTATVPSVSNPIFRVGWAARNTGNTSDITVEGASAGSFVEGAIVYDGQAKGVCSETLGVGANPTNIIALRNRSTFNEKANRAEIIPLLVSFATDTTKAAVFEIIMNPEVTTSDYIDWGFFNEPISLMEVATNKVEITGGTPIACFIVKSASSLLVDMQKILQSHPPGAEFSIAAKVTSGSASDMDASVTWKEDL